MLKKYCLLCLLAVVVMLGCSRKGDEVLPERLGDLKVGFRVVNAPGLEGRPATVRIRAYSLVAQQRGQLMRDVSVTTAVDTEASTVFNDLGVGWYEIELTVTGVGIDEFTCPPDDPDFLGKTAYVQEGMLTDHGVISINYGQERCRSEA